MTSRVEKGTGHKCLHKERQDVQIKEDLSPHEDQSAKRIRYTYIPVQQWAMNPTDKNKGEDIRLIPKQATQGNPRTNQTGQTQYVYED